MPEMSTPLTYDQLKPEQPTTWLAGARDAEAAQASAPDSFSSVNATASRAGTRDAAAAAGATRDASAQMATATGYNAQTGEIEDNALATSAGQMEHITGRDSPMMRRAAKEGMLAAGKRGLENSSFAAGSAMGAMVDKATPLAQQDASTYYQNLRANIDAVNRANELSTQRETDVSVENARLGTNVELANASEENRMEAINSQLATDVSLANAKAENDISILNSQLQTAVSQQNATEANRIRQQIAEMENQIEMRNADLQQQTNLANLDADVRTSTFNAEQRNAMSLEIERIGADLTRQYLQGQQEVDLAHVRGRYEQLLKSNEAAAHIYDSFLDGISMVMQNNEISPERVASYYNVMGRQLEGGLEFIDAINGLDLDESLLNAPTTTSIGSGDTSVLQPGPNVDSSGGEPTPSPMTPTDIPQQYLDLGNPEGYRTGYPLWYQRQQGWIS